MINRTPTARPHSETFAGLCSWIVTGPAARANNERYWRRKAFRVGTGLLIG